MILATTLVRCLVTIMKAYLVLVLMTRPTLPQVTLPLEVTFASNAVYLVSVTLEMELVAAITMLIGPLI